MGCIRLRAWRIALFLIVLAGRSAGPCLAQAPAAVPAPTATHLPADSLAGAEGNWYRVQTPHFEILGNADPDTLKRVAVAFETFRWIVGSSFAAERSAPLLVIVFKDEASFAPYKRDERGHTETWLGVYIPGPDGKTIAFNGGTSNGALPRVFHEYTHHILHHRFLWIPAWLHEGAAVYFSTVRLTKEGAEIGWPPSEHRRMLVRGPLLPLGSLFVTSPFTEDENQAMFYAESWALYDYLTQGRKDGPAQLGAFLTALEQGRKEEEAFRASFGVSYDVMEQELRHWVLREVHPVETLKFSAPASAHQVASRPMTRADALANLGLYALRAMPFALDLAEAHFRAAIAEGSTLGRAYAGLGTVRSRRLQRVPAIEAFEQGIRYSPDDPVPFILYAEACLDPFQSKGATIGVRSTGLPDELLRARALLGRALEIDPDRAETCAQFGFTYLFDPGDITDGVTWLQRACELEPASVNFAYDLFMLLWEHGRQEEARPVGETILARCHDAKINASVRALLNGTSDE